MRIFDGKEYRDMTAEEIAAMKAAERLAAIEERSRPMAEAEVARLLIAQHINTLSVDDHTALRMKDFYPEWITGASYEAGFKAKRNGTLWRVLQAHTSQETWEPENAASLWETVNETHDGTVDDPVPYEGNMALEQGKYYIQDHVIYLCIRGTENPVYHKLSELADIYVEIA